MDWSQSLAKQFASKAISFNIWAISSFAHEDIGIAALSAFPELTGGKFYKIVLGSYPKVERIRMGELMRNVLGTKLAMNCLLKLRTSSHVRIKEGSTTGLMFPDEEHEAVYRLSSCSPESSFGFEVGYNNSLQDDHIILQMAFSFHSIIESDYDLEESSNDKEETYSCNSFLEIVYDTLDIPKSQVKNPDSIKVNEKYKNAFSSKSKNYNHKKKLIVIKTLRIVTVSIPCSSNIEKVQNSCHLPTVASLIFRKSMKENKKYFNTNHFRPIVSKIENNNLLKKLNLEIPGFRSVLNIAIDHILMMKSCNEDFELNDVIKGCASVLKILYSILDYLILYSIHKSHFSDEAAEFFIISQNIDSHYCYRFLYPQLTPVTSDFLLESKSIPLSRSSVVSCGSPFLLIDSLFEIVLYKNLLVNKSSDENDPSENYHQSNAKTFLSNDIQRRLFVTPYIPKCHKSEAGFSSSNYFTSHLIDDISRSGFVYSDFIDLITSLLE